MMTAQEVADYLRTSQNYVYDLANSGDLPSYKIGRHRRFRPSDVEAWLLDQGSVGPAAEQSA